MLKNLNKFAALLFGGIVACTGTAIGATIISDNFTGTNTALLHGRAPTTSLPGGTWLSNGQFGSGTISGNAAMLGGNGTTAVFDIASTGGYTKPTTIVISGDIRVNNIDGTYFGAPRGVGIGFMSTAPAQLNFNSFIGLSLRLDGVLQLMPSPNATTNAVASGISGFSGNTSYKLSYTINTTTAAITSITLAGSSADFSSIITASAGHFTNANTRYAGIRASAGSGTRTGFVDNFVVIPEPTMGGVIGIAAVGLLSRRRRMA